MNELQMFIIIILGVSLFITINIIKQKNRSIHKLKKHLEIGKKITSNIKIKPLLQEIIEITNLELGAEASSLYLIDEEKQELWFEVALGAKSKEVKEIRLKIGDGVAGWVAKEGKALNLKDVNKDVRFRKDIGEKIEFKQKAMLTIPVKFKDKTIGVLQVINKKGGGYFTEEDQELLEGMSTQIAIALENAKLFKNLRQLFVGVIRSLASAVDARDPYTNGHSTRVAEYSLLIAKELGFKEDKLERLEYMAILHDVGKIGIRDNILNKTTKLNDDEFLIMQKHPQIGAEILGSVELLKEILDGVKYHHEKYDGSGYMEGIKGEDIPLSARIIAVADTYDAMTTDRPYRKGLSHETAMKEINNVAGKQLDPKVVAAFSKVIPKKDG